MKKLKNFITEASSVKYTPEEAYKIISNIYDAVVYVKSVNAKYAVEERKRFNALDKKYGDEIYAKEWSAEFDKINDDLAAEFYDAKYKEYSKQIDDTVNICRNAMTKSELNKLPKRGGFRQNLFKAFLEKFAKEKIK